VDNGQQQFAFVTMDTIGAGSELSWKAWNLAKTQGFSIPYERCTFSASHTHSGPGALSSDFLWSAAPATDLVVPKVQQQFVQSIAQAMLEAEQNLQPAKIDIGMGILTGVTHNRRTNVSPYVNWGTIDPHLGVLRVDKADGTPLATIWNYAIHGICYDAPNMMFSSDVMGSVNDWIEGNIGGVSLFMNGDAGDVNPIFSVCCNDGPHFSGGPVIGKAVKTLYSTLRPTDERVVIDSFSTVIPFGATNLNLTLGRLENCTWGGPIDICSVCAVLGCDANFHLPSSWVSENPRFSAIRFTIREKNTVIVSIPGEALTELGWWLRNDTLDLGFDNTFLQGYTNEYMGYFAPPDEYQVGGYESLLTFWGEKTAEMIRKSCKLVAGTVSPSVKKTSN